MSDTPRTDAALAGHGSFDDEHWIGFARALERELSAVEAARKRNLERAIELEKTNAMLLADNGMNTARLLDLAMIVKRLALGLRNANPDSHMPEQAIAFLTKHGLQGDALRK